MNHSIVLNKRIIGLHHHFHDRVDQSENHANESKKSNGQKPNGNSIMAYIQRISVLENELQKAREEAFQSGFEEGQKSMDTEMKRQMEELPREFASMGQQLLDQFKATIDKMEKPILHFALQITRKILGQALKDDEYQKEMLLSQIRKFLATVSDESKIIIHVNPKQMEWISNIKNIQSTQSARKMLFHNNDRLLPGECLLETEDYIMDGTVSGQLERIEKKIMSEK